LALAMMCSIGADTFIFVPGMQIDIIFDYADGNDLLDVSDFCFTNFATEVQPRINTVNGKAVLDLANGDWVILNGVSAGDLDAGDFILA
jgi:serralysin